MKTQSHQQGFSLIELMIATSLGLLVGYAVLETYLAQSQMYKTSKSQSLILDTENALVNLISPTVRSAGFFGCGSTTTATSNLNGGGPAPIGTFNTTPAMISGYNGSGSTYTITQLNAANDGIAGDWSPTLPASLTGLIEKGNDAFIVLGPPLGSYPIGVTLINPGTSSFSVQSTAGTSMAAGQIGAVSDCAKTMIFSITGFTTTTITHNAGAGTLDNSISTFPLSFQVGSQFIQLQQTAYFVAKGEGGDSALMQAVLSGNTWTVQPLVPGVELMKVQYGIGSNGLITQYVSANAVPDWTKVYALRLGFLIGGQLGSGSNTTTNYTILNTVVTVPGDNRLRHVFEMNIQLRNAS